MTSLGVSRAFEKGEVVILRLVLSLSACLLVGVAVVAQESRCADCHIANPDAPGAAHVWDWDRSAHGRNRVGCEKCHGGDPTTFERTRAHQEIRAKRDTASPLHWSNIARTCGTCHAGPFVAFQKSRHHELARSGDRNAPTCVTCHGEVGALRPSPRALEGACARCHGPGKAVERAAYPPEGRQMLEQIEEVRESLKSAKRLIDRVKDEKRRAEFTDAYRQAEVPLIDATEAGHAFVFEQLQERLGVARERIGKLLDRLVNAGS
jgi:hypothetical protein